ncbi:MAG: hypothetical protein A2Y65_10110 [Deltaproteobacteria bacterium RBG_13_52_11]|nr:MAG: hypothetical protein A2Y65_10110 [Deltaproteobacteria bacterium RBG_13_52_11]
MTGTAKGLRFVPLFVAAIILVFAPSAIAKRDHSEKYYRPLRTWGWTWVRVKEGTLLKIIKIINHL